MPAEKTHSDAIRYYLTGAASDSSAQSNHDASLGNFRSSTALPFMMAIDDTEFMDNQGLIVGVSGANGPGTGIITALASDQIAWTPPGGTQGAPVTITPFVVSLLEGGGSETDKFITFIESSVSAYSGSKNFILSEQKNVAPGFDAVTDAERVAGDTEYRCLCIKNVSAEQATTIKALLATLGTQRVSDSGQLGASGAGTITTTGSFADWPDIGYCAIYNGAAEREIVYYSSRTTTALTVPAIGRGLLGTTAAAGLATDTIDAIPGTAIGLDAPTSQPSGSFVDNTGSGEGTAPAGVVFSSPIFAADALSIGSLNAGEIYGIWLKREIPAGAQSQSNWHNEFKTQFDSV